MNQAVPSGCTLKGFIPPPLSGLDAEGEKHCKRSRHLRFVRFVSPVLLRPTLFPAPSGGRTILLFAEGLGEMAEGKESRSNRNFQHLQMGLFQHQAFGVLNAQACYPVAETLLVNRIDIF